MVLTLNEPAFSYWLPELFYDTCGGDSWTATSTTNSPSARAGHSTVWTGTEMIVWGGIVLVALM